MPRLHLLMTEEFYENKPDFVEVTSFANISVIFEKKVVEGDNAFISYPEEKRKEVQLWLKTHEEIYVGNGSPMMESFQIMTPEDVKLEGEDVDEER